MNQTTHVLIVEDLPTDAELTEHEARKVLPDCKFLRVETREDFLAALASFRPDLIISDYKLPQFDGLSALKLALEHAPETPFIIVTGSMNEDTAVECMKAGAWDYVIKEHIKRLGPAIMRAREQQRLRARQRVDELERERLMTAIEQVGETIIITDPASVIQYVNPAFEKVTLYTRAEALGAKPSLCKSGRQDQAFYRELWGSISSGKAWEGRMVNKRKDGTLYTEEAAISPVRDAAGKITNYVAVKKDITAQLQLEDQLQQAHKMEAVGLLAGGVAHDFNNILTAIISYADLLHNGLPADSAQRADAREILTAAGRAAALTRQLLAFSRRQILAPRVLDLNKIAADMTSMLRRLLGENVELKTNLAPQPCLVKVDPGQLEQVLLNLAVNARDAMPKGGAITLETAALPATEDPLAAHPGLPRGPLVRLRVSDTGTGMTKEVRKRVFEPFFTTKGKDQGTGLGLATVFGIVKQSGGEIEVSSEPGAGTVFTVYLPGAEAEPQPEQSGPKPAAAAKGTETILLVEDDETLRRLGERILKESGYKVLTACNGASALAELEHLGKPVDLLVTDVVMPGITGRELALEAARRKLAQKTLYMSGYTDGAIVNHGVLEPGLAFIYKPFSVEAFAAKLREVLNGPASQAKP
ncbi:MAG: hypothetical protein AUJ51_09745 [Elusimicrobia bacterium CG1_02_56_21]|nr:MAG: hypothetical protein AUJ51_09745 [Elusimicrobia bacterium CG1_02_56_21]